MINHVRSIVKLSRKQNTLFYSKITCYKDQSIHYGPSHKTIAAQVLAKSVHSTHLFTIFIANIPEFCTVKKGRQVSLTVDDKFNESLCESYLWTTNIDNETALYRASRMIRK